MINAIIFLVIILCAYFLPCIVANRRKHNNESAITILNIFLGWTFIGWVAALVWSCTDNVKK